MIDMRFVLFVVTLNMNQDRWQQPAWWAQVKSLQFGACQYSDDPGPLVVVSSPGLLILGEAWMGVSCPASQPANR